MMWPGVVVGSSDSVDASLRAGEGGCVASGVGGSVGVLLRARRWLRLRVWFVGVGLLVCWFLVFVFVVVCVSRASGRTVVVFGVLVVVFLVVGASRASGRVVVAFDVLAGAALGETVEAGVSPVEVRVADVGLGWDVAVAAVEAGVGTAVVGAAAEGFVIGCGGCPL